MAPPSCLLHNAHSGRKAIAPSRLMRPDSHHVLLILANHLEGSNRNFARKRLFVAVELEDAIDADGTDVDHDQSSELFCFGGGSLLPSLTV